MAMDLLRLDTGMRYCRNRVVLERITMTPQLREPRPHTELHCVGITYGNVGRAVCLRATAQRLNVINTNGDRPTMSYIRQPQRQTEIAGGEHHGQPNE